VGVDTPSSAARRPVRLRRTVALLVLCALTLGLIWLASVPTRIWWTARQDQRPHSDVLLVLGASQYNGKPSPVLQARLAHALTLYHDGVAPRIVTVGGKRPGDNFTEASAGKDWLVSHGVPASAVLAVGSGTDTWNSIQAVAAEMKDRSWDSAVIVTDPWHSFRSREMARHAGLKAATSPTRSGPIVQQRHTELRYVIRETGAYLSWVWHRI
jgi:uncharacterized SAM-binding protein YcdF (DUF218 family)